MANDVKHFIKKNGFQEVTLIGHSMGAKTALTLALESPELVADVVAIDNAPIRLPLLEDFDRYIEGMQQIERAKVTTLTQADEIMQEYEKSSQIRLFLLTNLITQPEAGFLKFRIPIDVLACALGPLGDFPFGAYHTTRFEKPTLFIRALRSHYIPHWAATQIKRFFPNSAVVDVDCGHWIVQEKPKEFQKVTIEFLSRKPGSSRRGKELS